jgi:hypothetical protein
MLETTYEGAVRMLEDPWLFIWHLHLLLTCMHFLIWISSYGWIGGSGPKSIQVRLRRVITRRCNSYALTCKHFLFGSAPTAGSAAAGQKAYRCGCDVL